MSGPNDKNPPKPASDHVFLGRQPIFDTRSNVVAYELLFRKASTETANVPDATMATSQVVIDTLTHIGTDRVLSGKKGFINIGEEFLFSDNLLLLPPDQFGLEILETVPINDSVIKRLHELKKRGFSLAIDDFIDEPEILAPVIDIIDVLKVDFPLVSRQYIETIYQKIGNKKVKLLAEKVEQHEQIAHATRYSFTLFQGFFYEKPMVLTSHRIPPEQASILAILALVLREDVRMEDLHQAIKPHVELALSLIKLSNVVGKNPNKKITTIKDALISIGLGNLRRWLYLLIAANASSKNPYSQSILHLSAERGRAMELVASQWKGANRPDPDQAFLVGVLSTMDTLMEINIELLLNELKLGQLIKDAILRESGSLGHLLSLTRFLQNDQMENIRHLMEGIPVPIDKVFDARTQSILWADEMMRSV